MLMNVTDAPQILDIDNVNYLTLDQIGHIGPVARTFALQNDADGAERSLEHARDMVTRIIEDQERQAAAQGRIGSLSDPFERIERHADVIAARNAATEARAKAVAAQEEIGGIAFCVADDKLAYAHKTIDALSRKAVKIDCEPIALADTDERVLLHYTYAEDPETHQGYHADFQHTFVILTGSTPSIPGFEFIATVSVTEAGNLVKTVPAWGIATRKNMRDAEQGQAWLDSLDLKRFRSTGDVCEHCNTSRQRNDTFVVYNEATAEAKQVGRNCLKDFTGTNNPERIVKVLQQVWEAMRMLSSKGEAPVILMDTYLAHCAVIYRVQGGYVKGEHKYMARSNHSDMEAKRTDRDGRKTYVEPTEDDIAFARTVRQWALANLDDSDFGYNVKTAITPDVLNEKAGGYAAAAFAAWQRRQNDAAEEKAQAEQSFIGEMGQRATFALTVTNITWRPGYAHNTDAPTYTFEDEQGNRARWRASDTNGMKVGGTYEVKATVKKDGEYPGHEDHAKYGKTTHLTRLSVVRTINEPEEN